MDKNGKVRSTAPRHPRPRKPRGHDFEQEEQNRSQSSDTATVAQPGSNPP